MQVFVGTGTTRKSGEVYAIAVQKIEQLVFRVDAYERGDQRTCRGAGYDAREETAQVQRFNDS